MAKSQLVPAVLQALVLFTFTQIIWHNIFTKVGDDFQQYDSWKNFSGAIEQMTAINMNTTILTPGPDINGTRHWNYTINRTNETENFFSYDRESFYWKTLPRDLLFMAIVLPLQYLFQIWLERAFPGRARPIVVETSDKTTSIGEGSDPQEDEIIKRLVAQGKIKRSSLSWWNTFVKWSLDMTIGQILTDHLLVTLLEAAWHQHSFSYIWSELKWGLIWKPWVGLFSFRPLASLLSFIVVPAHQRIVFLQGADLIFSIFTGIFLTTILPWFMRTEFAKAIAAGARQNADDMMLDHVRSAHAALSKPTPAVIDALPMRIGDEL